MKLSLEQRRERNKILLAPCISTLLSVFLLFSCFFLPLLTASGDYREALEKYPDGDDAFGDVLTNEQAIDISMQEFFVVYWDIYADNSEEEAVISVCVFCGTAIISLIILIFTLLKKPIAVIVFNFLAALPYFLANAYIADKNFLKVYSWGHASELYCAAFILIFISAIWLLLKKKEFKHRLLIMNFEN